MMLPEKQAEQVMMGHNIYDDNGGLPSDFKLKMARLGCSGKIDETGQVRFDALFAPPPVRPPTPLLPQAVDVEELYARQEAGIVRFWTEPKEEKRKAKKQYKMLTNLDPD